MATAFKELHWSNDIPIKAYHLPESLPEALELLERFPGKARVLAGGTDIIPELRRRDIEAEVLVDISRLPGLNTITQTGEVIRLGALVTHAQAAASPLIREKAGLLADGAAAVGSPQIRNIATVAGNLISARPAADTSIPLLALQASVTLASKSRGKVGSADRFFPLGRENSVGRPSRNPQGNPLYRTPAQPGGQLPPFEQTQSPDPPHAGGGGRGNGGSGEETFRETTLALGPVAPTPYRARPAENILRGAALTREVIREAAAAAVQECSPRESLLRGSCDYRQEMIQVLVRRSIQKALGQAGFSLE